MRLDKYIADTGLYSRREISRLAHLGKITLDGAVCRDASVHIDPDAAVVCVGGTPVKWSRYTYIMLSKPTGYVSSTEDRGQTIMKLLPDSFTKMDMFPCGRLDIDTTGLLLITNDGDTAHRLLSPKHHVAKSYRFTCDRPLTDDDADALRDGIDIGGYVTKSAGLSVNTNGTSGIITITEGKFHQIKRMFEKRDNEITSLSRITFGSLTLDDTLKPGEWRYLTGDEIKTLTEHK